MNGNVTDITTALIWMINHPVDHDEMGRNARQCAKEKFDRKNSSKEFIETILT